MMTSWGQRIAHEERAWFVGRQAERDRFSKYLTDRGNEAPIFNVYGVSGIGKSSLLHQFRVIAERQGVPFVMLDSRDFAHTPTGFCQKLLDELDVEVKVASEEDPVKLAIQRLNETAAHNGLVLAIDTYEELEDMDYWIRQVFLSQLHDESIVVVSGRNPLRGAWMSSPAWRQMIQPIQLRPFDLATSRDYTSRFGLHPSSQQINRLHRLSHGHPLTLSLFLQVLSGHGEIDFQSSTMADVLDQLLTRWLSEIQGTSLYPLVEAASMVRVFDQDLLEAMIDEPVDAAEFNSLIQLSFVLRSHRGWFIHDGLRAALSQNFRQRRPQLHKEFRDRCIRYLYRHIPEEVSQSHTVLYVTDLMYVLGDTTIRAAFLDENPDQQYHFEDAHEGNLDELKQYIRDVLDDPVDRSHHQFIDKDSGQQHEMIVPKDFKKRALDLLDVKQLLALDANVVRMMKNEHHETVAFVVFIPIHKGTLLFLEQSPISKHYFEGLTKAQRKEYYVPPSSPAGWYLYHIDMYKANAEGRRLYFQSVMSLILQGGICIISSPIRYYQEVVRSIGWNEVPWAMHTDYGPEYPSPTFALDLRGMKLKQYVRALIEKAGISLEPSLAAYNLTPREQEIALSTLAHSSIAEIAAHLHVTEITVKKHLGKVYEKLGVKGKTELIKKLMSM